MGEEQRFESWCIVEVMGHQVYAGLVTEQKIGNASFVRVDVAESEGRAAYTKMLGEKSIFAITPCTEEVARRVMEKKGYSPMHMLALPPALSPDFDDVEYEG